MTRKEAKRRVCRYLLALIRNFPESWQGELKKQNAQDVQALNDALDTLMQALKKHAQRQRKES